MSSPSVWFLTRLLSVIHLLLFTDGNGRRSPRHGLLELPRASFKFAIIDYVSHPLIYRFQNVAGRTLVGLRFWNQVCCLHIFRVSRFGIGNLTHDGVGK